MIGWRQTLTTSPANHVRFLLVRAFRLADRVFCYLKLVFHLATFFARTRQKSERDWVVMSSVFVVSQSSCFFLCSREQICLVEDRLKFQYLLLLTGIPNDWAKTTKSAGSILEKATKKISKEHILDGAPFYRSNFRRVECNSNNR